MNTHYDEPLKAIDGRARMVRELVDKAVGRVRRAWQGTTLPQEPCARRNPAARHQRQHARHEVGRYGCRFPWEVG